MDKQKLEMIRELGWAKYLYVMLEKHEVKFLLAMFTVVVFLGLFFGV